MMTDQEVTTLAYSKSPKTLKRTTFQDELQAAVASRSSRTKAEQISNFNKIDDEEDDFLDKLLSSRKKRNAFKAGKSKAKLHTLNLSDDDEDKHSKPKKVSFLKSQRSSSDSKDKTASQSHENKPPESSVDSHYNINDHFSSQHSTNVSEDNTQDENRSVEPTDPQLTRKTSSQSYQKSDNTLSLPPLSDGSMEEASGSEEQRKNSVLGETFEVPPTSSFENTTSAGLEGEPPRPKPRQRTLRLKPRVTEIPAEETASQDLNWPQTSSALVPLSTDTSSNVVWTVGDHAISPGLSKSSSNKSEQSQLLSKSTLDSGSKNTFISDDSKEAEKNYSSFEESNGCSRDTSDQLSHAPDKSLDTMTSTPHSMTSKRSHSVCSKKVESKYLGTLKVLDSKVSLQESQPQAAESLRAAVYQEWLKKKREKLRQNIEVKKKEQLLKEKEKQEEKSKKEDVVASYEAWKEKKTESLRAKAKERNEKIRKEQQATEEKQEKRQSAKQVFEKWKQEHDHLLREKHRKQKETENKLQLQKQEREEERKKNSKSAFSDWCEKKKDVLHEHLERERKQIQTKVEEEQYLKEERDKMALETYEEWLSRKDLEQKKRRRERRVQAIIQDSPPPPWSPPNKTVPFGK